MQFTESHKATVANLKKILLRCQLPEASGEEMVGFGHVFYFVHDLEKHIAEEIQKAKAAQALGSQALEASRPLEPSRSPKKTKSKKSK